MNLDWSKVGKAVATIAPWIAGTLGTPVAGVAVKALVDVFGLTGPQTTPDNVIAALAGASPQQLQDLRSAEQKHQEFMMQIGYDNIDRLTNAEVADRDGARRREEVVKDRTPSVLAALAVILFLCLLVFVAAGQSPNAAMQAGFWMLAGASVSVLKDVYGYYFGSSKGSQDKDATISKLSGDS
jgi:hypothetical protein